MTRSLPEELAGTKIIERTIPFYEAGPAGFFNQSVLRESWNSILKLSRSRFARSVGWSVIGNTFAQGGSFLSCILLARVLGREAFGQFALIQSTVTALTCLASLGLGLTATKFISEYLVREPEKIGRLLGLSTMLVVPAGFCFSAGLAAFAPMMAVRSDYSGITTAFRLSTICVFFLTLTGYQLGVLAGFENFHSIGRIGVLCGLANPLLSWCGAVKFGLQGAVLAQCASAVLLWGLYARAVRTESRLRGIAVRYRGAWEQRSILTRVSIPATAAGMLATLAIWGSNAVLVRDRGYGELALFTAASNLRSVVVFLPMLIRGVTTPRLNHLFAAGDHFSYSRAFWAATGANGLLALFAASLFFLEGHRFLRLFGKEFAGSDWLLALILSSAVIEVMANNLCVAVIAACRFWWNLAAVTIWAALLLGITSVVVPRGGSVGVAAGYLAAWSVLVVVYAAVARRQTGAGGSL